MILSENPFKWGYLDELSITSRVPALAFRHTNGSDISVANLSNDIKLVMFESDGKNYTITNDSIINSKYYDPQANLVFETWTLEAAGKKKLLVDASKGTSGSSGLHVQIRVKALPNETETLQGIMPQAFIKAYLGSGYEASETKFLDFKEIKTPDMMARVDHRHYTFFIAAE